MKFFADPYFWLVVGFVGQGLFTLRFVVQWLASERSGVVVVPSSFWWLSIFGAAALLSYAISRRDPVIAAGQSMGVLVYVRNLMLEKRRRAGSVPAPHFRAETPEPANSKGIRCVGRVVDARVPEE